MTESKTVRINGQEYDAKTGLPIDQPAQGTASAQTPATQSTPSKAIHTKTQRSKTLHRGVAKAQASKKAVSEVTHSDIKRSKRIQNRATSTGTIEKATGLRRTSSSAKKHIAPLTAQTPPSQNPTSSHADVQHKAIHTATPQTSAQATHRPAATSRQVKEQVIQAALATSAAPKTPHSSKPTAAKRRRSRNLIIAGSIVLLVGLAGYIAYLNLPSLSVQVAAAQTGVPASYPHYTPDGYSLVTPVTADGDIVRMSFSSNSGIAGFTITQAKSNWDSSAVQDDVQKASDGQYLTTKDRGLTIYTYNGKAAWVNKGILYRIDGEAKLSSDQIQKIATSL